MEKIKFENSSSIEVINNKFDYGIGDFSKYYKGEGVYCFVIGSRGEIDDIMKVSDNNEFELSSKEELMEECMEDSNGEEYEYWSEFCESGKIDSDEVEGYYEIVSEEDGREYFYIVE